MSDLDYVTLLNDAQAIVRDKFVWKRFIDGTPLDNDVPVWMADFAVMVLARHDRALWRPIAEAPRDGTRVIGWGGCDTAIVSWQDHPEGGAWEDDYDTPWEVTHFRPLPAGPEGV